MTQLEPVGQTRISWHVWQRDRRGLVWSVASGQVRLGAGCRGVLTTGYSTLRGNVWSPSRVIFVPTSTRGRWGSMLMCSTAWG